MTLTKQFQIALRLLFTDEFPAVGFLDVAFAMVLHSCFKFCLAGCGCLFDVPLELGADALQVFEQKLAGFGLHEITVCFAV